MTHRRNFLGAVAGLGMAAAAPQATTGDRSPVLGPYAGETGRPRAPQPGGRNAQAKHAGRVRHRESRRIAANTPIWRPSAGCWRGSRPGSKRPLDPGPERDLQQRTPNWRVEAIHQATDPQSPDFLNFHEGAQPLVDCGFLAQALLRAPNELWKKLDAETQQNLAAALLSSRVITPGLQQLAAVRRHRRGRPGHDGRALGRHAHRLRRPRSTNNGTWATECMATARISIGTTTTASSSSPCCWTCCGRWRQHAKTWDSLLPDIAHARQTLRRHPGTPDRARMGATRRSAGRSRTVAAPFNCWRRWRCWANWPAPLTGRACAAR